MQSENEKEKTKSISEEEIDKAVQDAQEVIDKKVEPIPDSQKTNPNKDLIPQRVKINGLGYVEYIGTKERDATFESLKKVIFKVVNAAFAVSEIDIENGTFTAKLLNYSPLVREKEIESNSSSSSSDS